MADRRARALALTASGLAAAAGVRLPQDLELWRVAGGRPASAARIESDDPAGALVTALESALTDAERRGGAHYTPPELADQVVASALAKLSGAPSRAFVDPSCGGGAVLLAAGRRLEAAGVPPRVAARDLLWGADIDPLAAAVTEAAIAIWSGGTAPAAGHVVAADVLARGRRAWPTPPPAGFDVVVGNPPFQGQLAKGSSRDASEREALRERFGAAVTPYVDTAALFLLVAVELAARGGRVALVQPRSTAAARDAGGVREALAARARLVDLWAPEGFRFAARVHVCVPVLAVGRRESAPDWAGRLAASDGVPPVRFEAGRRTVGDRATAVAGFRQHYYGLAPHVREAGRSRTLARLGTSGLVDIGSCHWGRRPVRFAGRAWERPAVDRRSLAAGDDPAVAAWVERLMRPKIVVASQTKVVEAAVDRTGSWVPCTPVVSVVPRDERELDLLAAALCSPPASAWAAARVAGSGLSPGAIRMSSDLALSIPLPADRRTWRKAATALAEGDLAAFGRFGTAMHHLPDAVADAVEAWWTDARQ